MRCSSCNYATYDYSEGYETCYLGIDDKYLTENRFGPGCIFRQSQLDKWGKEVEQAEQEEYARMGKWFSEQEKLGWSSLDE